MADNDYEIMRKTLDLLGIDYKDFTEKADKGFVLVGKASGDVIAIVFDHNGMFKGVW